MNSIGFAYVSTDGLEQYYKPGAIIVAGANNVTDPKFQEARRAGAKVLRYINWVEAPLSIPAERIGDSWWYSGADAWTPSRINWPGTYLLDIRRQSRWSDFVVARFRTIIEQDLVDGVMPDVVSNRLWSTLALWDTWPAAEQKQWTDGNIDLLRRVDAVRQIVNPNFLIVNNGVLGEVHEHTRVGELFVDGRVLERPRDINEHKAELLARPYGHNRNRVVAVVGRTYADAIAASKLPGVTHVSHATQYLKVEAPSVGFSGWPVDWHAVAVGYAAEIAENELQIAELGAQVTDLKTDRDALLQENIMVREGIAEGIRVLERI